MDERDGQRLKKLLESYGADRARWPEGNERLAVNGNLPEFRSAAALDRLLAAASNPEPSAGLSGRIIAAAAPPAPNVVPFPQRPENRAYHWPAVAALAASLAIGIYLGATNAGDVFFPTRDTASLDDPLDLMSAGQNDDTSAGDSV